MALVKCRECGKEISNNASSCPYCGYKNRKNNLKLIIIALIILVVILLFGISILYIKYKLDNDNYDDGYN